MYPNANYHGFCTEKRESFVRLAILSLFNNVRISAVAGGTFAYTFNYTVPETPPPSSPCCQQPFFSSAAAACFPNFCTAEHLPAQRLA